MQNGNGVPKIEAEMTQAEADHLRRNFESIDHMRRNPVWFGEVLSTLEHVSTLPWPELQAVRENLGEKTKIEVPVPMAAFLAENPKLLVGLLQLVKWCTTADPMSNVTVAPSPPAVNGHSFPLS